jgi:glycosyltransferase involved in cell wall biosynthesis
MRHLAVPSEYLREVFAEAGLRTTVVPNLVNLNEFRFRSREPIEPNLICTRGCEPYYAVDDVVRAFSTVQKEYPGARLTLVGGGSLEPSVRSLVSELRLQHIEFHGHVPRETVGSYYDRSDIFINASLIDNMPVSILEAFASGLPVVSTAPDGIKRLVEHGKTGLLSPSRDWKALGENLLRVLRDPQLAQTLAKNGQEQVVQYSWEAVRPQWLSLYRDAQSRRQHSQAPAAIVHQSATSETK